jgi:hypothetical protein
MSRNQRKVSIATFADESATRPIELPGGFVERNGAVHRDAEIVPLCGRSEEMLSIAPPDATAASLTTLALSMAVTRIGSIRKISPHLIRELTIPDREYLLWRLRELTIGPRMWIRLTCPSEDCAEGMEMPIDLSALPIERRALKQRTFRMNLPPIVEFRLPCGADVEEACTAGIERPEAAVDFLLRRCILRVGSKPVRTKLSLPAAARDAIERRFEELLPDVTPELESRCPSCQHEFSMPVDLAHAVLGEFIASARKLEREVHLIAWHYHWHEADILAMPRSKRRRYVQMIEDEREGAAEGWMY